MRFRALGWDEVGAHVRLQIIMDLKLRRKSSNTNIINEGQAFERPWDALNLMLGNMLLEAGHCETLSVPMRPAPRENARTN